jgi:enhancer of polycomb-like protein
LIRSSETVEQLSNGWGGLNYVMDERDEAWLSEFNSKQEGTSSVKQEPYANGAPNGKETGKSKKGKEKDRKDDKEGTGALKISEDVFEYVMGMLEHWTEKNVPMLHTVCRAIEPMEIRANLSHQDLAQLPTFDAVESVFRDTPPASFYPAYEVPQCLPSPPLLTRIARNIFPYWQQRKEQREGKSIIPQLNLSWSEENDPYICFRRRDKPVTRKTRNRDTTSSDRMTRIQNELTQAMALVRMVSEREKQKKKSYLAEKDIWQARYNVLDVKRKSGVLNCTPEEEALLFPTRNNSNNALLAAATAIANGNKRQRMNNAEKEDSTRSAGGLGSGFPSSSGLATGGSTMKSGLTNGGLSARSRAASPIMERVPPEQLAGLLAEKVERELKRKREADRNIEDSTNLAYQPLPIASALRHFRCLPSTESLAVSQSSVPSKPWDPESPEIHPTGEEDASSIRPNHQTCFRLRRGRGGIIRLDRRMPSVAHSQAMERSRYGDSFLSRMFMVNPLARRRHRDPSEEQIARPDGVSLEEEDEEAARILSERWRYDAVQGTVGVGMGVTDDDQIVVDDYEIK